MIESIDLRNYAPALFLSCSIILMPSAALTALSNSYWLVKLMQEGELGWRSTLILKLTGSDQLFTRLRQ
jgi:hypothetical protein